MNEYQTKRADGRRFAMLIGGPADPVRVWEEVGGKPFPCTTFGLSVDGGPARVTWAAERLQEFRLAGHFMHHVAKVWGWSRG